MRARRGIHVLQNDDLQEFVEVQAARGMCYSSVPLLISLSDCVYGGPTNEFRSCKRFNGIITYAISLCSSAPILHCQRTIMMYDVGVA